MNTLKYKGYLGSVGYSESDKVFFGKIEGIDDLVNYEGESVSELTAAFHEAVDDYLAFCQDQGVKPEKSYFGSFNVRIAPQTHRSIAMLAAEAGISINAFVKKVLDEAVRMPPTYSVVDRYGRRSLEPAVLNEPSVRYGNRARVEFEIPGKDLPFAQELAERMGWTLLNQQLSE